MPDLKGGLPVLVFASAAEWESWLARHGGSSKGAWLKFAKKGSAAVTLSKQEAIDSALCHGWIDGQLDRQDDQHWLVRFTPRKAGSKWSLKNRERAAELLAAGRVAPAGRAQVEAAQLDGRWEAAYESQSRATIPDDLATALAAVPPAKALFDQLDSANRYAVLYRVNTAKSAEARARQIERLVAMLSRGETIHPRRERSGRSAPKG